MALLMVVLTGFAALAIDTGVAYDQSRTDQDVSDAAALAASYWIYSHANTQGAEVSGAFAAAVNVAQLDCTGPSAPCSLNVSFYTTYPGTPPTGCTASVANVDNSTQVATEVTDLNSDCGTAPKSVADAGASVGSTAYHYLSSLVTKSKSFSIGDQAVAQVSGGTSGSSGELYLNCVLCILAQPNGYNQSANGLSIASNSDGLDLATDGSNVAVNGNLDCEGGIGDAATLDTEGSSANGIVDVAGTYTDNCTPTWEPASNPQTGTTPIPDPLANLQMPNVDTYTTCTASVTITSSSPTSADTLKPGCYGQITIDGTATGGTELPGGQTCLSDGDGLDVIFDTGLYIIYQGLTIEGDDPTVESEAGTTHSSCDQGVTLDFVCSTNDFNGVSGSVGPAACNYNNNEGQAGAEFILDTYNLTGSSITTCSSDGVDPKNKNYCDYQWNIFPQSSGSWTNLGILYDQNNTSPIVTATETPDPDSDHNGAIYAARATYIMANYSPEVGGTNTNTPLTTSGNSCTTPLGAPVVVDYLQIDANYMALNAQDELMCHEFDWTDPNPFSYQLDNDVELNAGGPGGLVG
jgi:hypothetical protein